MSYRTFKKALGETNLERKCRLLFGTCLLLLISASFWWYSTQADRSMINIIGENLANSAVFEAHLNKQEQDHTLAEVDRDIAEMLRQTPFYWEALQPKNEEGINEPTDGKEWELMVEWDAMGKQLDSDEDIEKLEIPSFYRPIEKNVPAVSDSNLTPDTEESPNEEKRLFYQYYEPVFTRTKCVGCHNKPILAVSRPNLRVGDLLVVMRVEVDAEAIRSEQQLNRAKLGVAAIVTVFLAMIALYVIVRYVIVKPLRHLRDVSNAVRRGDVEQRAVIHTGDEFEELGAAFNRMLRQLLRQQDELRNVNGELDGKLDELAQANMRLFEMNQLKSDFLATVSHELRTPLNSIIGFSDLLSNVEKLADKEQRYASNIQRSGKQLLEMINDILDLAKIESGKLEVRISNLDIATVVATQCDMARPLSERKNIDIECEARLDLPTMRQDRGKIEQILNNLLSNAIKFTPDGGRITVITDRDRSDDLRLTIADTGVGISETEQSLVFEKFRQGTSVLHGGDAMTREYSGTGLGLSIVRELCRLLGGEITLESELGKGSEFTVHLPWHLSEVPRIESPLADELRKMTKPRPETIGTLPSASSHHSQDDGLVDA